MRKFLINIIVLFLILGVFIGSGELYLRYLPNPYSFKKDWMETNADMLETLILGSSQIEMGISPKILGNNTFNLAMPNGLLEYDYYLLEKYSSKYKKLKSVIIELSCYNVFALRFEDRPNDKYRALYYRIYMDYPVHRYSPSYNFEFSNFDFFRYRLASAVEYLLFNKPLPDECDSLGWVTGNKRFDTESYASQISDVKKTLEGIKCKDYDMVAYNCHYLDQIIHFCRKHDIEPIIVILPMSKNIVNLLDNKQLSTFYKTINNYRRQGITTLNYLKDSIFSLSDYINSNHLNRNGAVKFTNIIKKDITVQ